MITSRLKQRLKKLRLESPELYENSEYAIPVKITIQPSQDTGLQVRVNARGVEKRTFGVPTPSFDEFIQELESQRVQNITYQSRERNYVLAPLNTSQIGYFSASPYVREIDDDTPVM